MSPHNGVVRFLSQGFPRVSGDEPQNAGGSRQAAPFSPRERG